MKNSKEIDFYLNLIEMNLSQSTFRKYLRNNTQPIREGRLERLDDKRKNTRNSKGIIYKRDIWI